MATIGCFSDYLENKVLNDVFVTPAVYLGLLVSPSSDAVSGSEATMMTQYARQRVYFAPSGTGSITTSTPADFGVVTGSGCTITHWAVYDNTTGGNMLAYGKFDPQQTVSVANNILVPTGSITITLD